MNIEDIEHGMIVKVFYNGKWWTADVTGVSKKTSRVTVWIGDYMRLNVHCSQLKKVGGDKK